jgi:hypothetical protein
MKYIHVYALFLCVLCTSRGQGQTGSPARSAAIPSSQADDSWVHTKYEYTDAARKRVVIQNSRPKGGQTTKDRHGKQYLYAVFWTRVVNETASPVEVTMEFPADSVGMPSSPGVYIKLVLPSDTMTIDKGPLYDYGLDMKSFLYEDHYGSSSLKRVVPPGSSGAFYVVALSVRGVNGPLRAGLSVRGRDLFYRLNDKEIPCGSLNVRLRQ